MASMWDDNNGKRSNGSTEPETQFAAEPFSEVGVVKGVGDDSMLGMLIKFAQTHIQRDPNKLIARAKQIGGLLGEDGFYRFRVGGDYIEGESIQLAQALVQDWRGISVGVNIVRSEPLADRGQRVHLRARVIDLVTLVFCEVDQVVSTAPPPGKFADKPDQRERWHAMQLQNAASKILRNAILRVLPDWYKSAALNAAMAVADNAALGTVVDKDGNERPRTAHEARAAAIAEFDKIGITADELVLYLEEPIDMWAVPQIQALMVLYKDLKRERISFEQFRTGLKPRANAPTPNANGGGEPRRAALGLPAKTGGQTVAEAMAGAGGEQRDPQPVATSKEAAAPATGGNGDAQQQLDVPAPATSSKPKARG